MVFLQQPVRGFLIELYCLFCLWYPWRNCYEQRPYLVCTNWQEKLHNKRHLIRINIWTKLLLVLIESILLQKVFLKLLYLKDHFKYITAVSWGTQTKSAKVCRITATSFACTTRAQRVACLIIRIEMSYRWLFLLRVWLKLSLFQASFTRTATFII